MPARDPIDARHGQRLLAWLLVATMLAGFALDGYYTITAPGYWDRMMPLAVGRTAFLVLLLILNHGGWTQTAAVGVVVLLPFLIAVRLLGGLTPLPIQTLSYIELDIVVASLLFAVRGTVVATTVNIVLLVAFGFLVPGVGVDTVVIYSATSFTVGALLIAGIRHRASVARDKQARLLASEGRKRAAFDTALDCVLAIDREGKLLEFNSAAERTFGYRRAEVLGRELAEVLIPVDQREGHRAGLRRYLREGTSRLLGRRFEVRALRADGTEFPCELAIGTSGHGEDLVFIANLRDLTEQKQVEARQAELEALLRESQKMQAIGQLAGGVAHDFNNTLQAIGGYLSFALEEARARAPELAADLEEAEKATHRAAGLTRQLLAISRRQVLDLEVVSINDIVAAFLAIVGRLISERINLRFHPGQDLPAVRVDRGQLQQVILNLCLNARDAMPDGGDLTLETQPVSISEEFVADHPWARVGSFVALAVVDSGVGMTAEIQGRMFEPFFSTKGPDQGTGLGLAVVYGIIEQHQGFIRVDSTPGGGTTVWIYLPAAAVSAPPPEPDVAVVPSGGTETILVAEDADAIRDVIKRTLESAGYRVVAAANGEDALRLFERDSERVALVVLDAIMPHRNGREVFTAMRGFRPDLPALFLSGCSADTIDPRWLAKVGAELVMKPIAPGELLGRVRRILDTRSAGLPRETPARLR